MGVTYRHGAVRPFRRLACQSWFGRYALLWNLSKKQKRGFRNNYFLKAFFLGLGLSFLVFIPFIVVDGGRFLFYGDFNVQQVPFYRLAHDAVRSGNLGWSHLTDLGANFIGSYSFYLLGSPFFWLTIPFPSEWVQYLMGPLLILKFACATLDRLSSTSTATPKTGIPP